MKRKALVILIIVIALSVASWLVYNQISKLQNQISELRAQNDELQEQNSDLQDLINNQIRELQEQFNESYKNSPVRIVSVSYLGGFNPVVGGNHCQRCPRYRYEQLHFRSKWSDLNYKIS